MRVLKNLFGDGSKIHADEIVVGTSLLSRLLGTSVIVESGSNENGTYVKFGNGVCIAQHRIVVGSVSIPGNTYTPPINWVKPTEFLFTGSSAYSEFASFSGISGTGNPLSMITTKGGWTGALFDHRGYNTNNSEPITTYYVDLFAFGVWK